MFGFKRKKKKNQQELDLERVSSLFGTLDVLESKGLLLWQERERRLLIMWPLACVNMRNREAWTNFLNNVYLWQVYKRQQEAWQNYIIKQQSLAIQRVQGETKHKLTKAEIDRLRRGVLENLTGAEISNTKIERFEFFIVTDDVTSIPDKETKGEVVLVGVYDPETNNLEMTMWEDIAQAIKE